MEVIEQLLVGLKFGPPQAHCNLALYPLVAEFDRLPRYLLLDEALEKNVARITEVSAEGRVPELAFENASAEKILLVDGDELVGAKQNRILNLSILVGAGRKLNIPVSCVEQGRWRYASDDFASAGRALFAKARARKMSQVTESLRTTRSRAANQSQIWADVADKVAFCGASSQTLAMGDAYESRAADLAAYLGAFKPTRRQVGALVQIDGRTAGIELFDSSAAFARYFPKLVRSYALDALETAGVQPVAPAEPQARSFLDRLRNADGERVPALGEGEDLRLTGNGIAGGALVLDGRVVHLAGFQVPQG
jgi:hypothetical protein